jgi:glycosyltransferase involved in cell wall biosynthesis
MKKIFRTLRNNIRLMNHQRLKKRKSKRQPGYLAWVKNHDCITEQIKDNLKIRLSLLNDAPKISLIMPVYNTKLIWLQEAIDSVKKQIYQNWELCIADDNSTDTAVRDLIKKEAEQDPRIKYTFRTQNGHICAASNSALGLVTADYVALIDHDDIVHEHALLLMAEAISHHPNAKILYSDEDKIDAHGNRCHPHFKCDWNPELLWTQNYICHLTVYSTKLIREVGAFRQGYEGSQDHDLVLRCTRGLNRSEIIHIPHILYSWRQHAESTASAGTAKPYAAEAGVRAVQDHLKNLGVNAKVKANFWGCYNIKMIPPESQPFVSIIIPTKNRFDLIETCISSVLNKTTYKNYEIIVIDNGSDDEATLNYLQKIKLDTRVNVITDNRDFNYSALNNHAVTLARGDFILLLNNDTEVISGTWLTEMVGTASLPDVGAVGARLWYSNQTLQHGGVIIGFGGVANHAHRGISREDLGYMGRAQLIQEFSAVTAACLLVRKDLYLRAGGLNEKDLAVAFNDIDFCLRLRELGYRNIWNPNAELFHHESVSRGKDEHPAKRARLEREIAYMKTRWKTTIENDPMYNPNLNLHGETFTVAHPPRVDLNIPWYNREEQAKAIAARTVSQTHNSLVKKLLGRNPARNIDISTGKK